MNTLREYVITPGLPAAAGPASRVLRAAQQFGQLRAPGVEQDSGLGPVEQLAIASARKRAAQRIRRRGVLRRRLPGIGCSHAIYPRQTRPYASRAALPTGYGKDPALAGRARGAWAAATR